MVKASEFRFKKFSVFHDRCSIKVGTDGILLGAWADLSNTKKILDIGAGSGLITLMVAQRNSDAIVHGVEIDDESFRQAQENAAQSKYSNRIEIFNNAIQDYHIQVTYDAIVCNPPFYQSGLLPENLKFQIAKHMKTLAVVELFISVNRLLSSSGIFSLIFSNDNKEMLIDEAASHGLYPKDICTVYTKEGKNPKRILISFSRYKHKVTNTCICIYTADGKYTDTFKQLTMDFYLFDDK